MPSQPINVAIDVWSAEIDDELNTKDSKDEVPLVTFRHEKVVFEQRLVCRSIAVHMPMVRGINDALMERPRAAWVTTTGMIPDGIELSFVHQEVDATGPISKSLGHNLKCCLGEKP